MSTCFKTSQSVSKNQTWNFQWYSSRYFLFRNNFRYLRRIDCNSPQTERTSGPAASPLTRKPAAMGALKSQRCISSQHLSSSSFCNHTELQSAKYVWLQFTKQQNNETVFKINFRTLIQRLRFVRQVHIRTNNILAITQHRPSLLPPLQPAFQLSCTATS